MKFVPYNFISPALLFFAAAVLIFIVPQAEAQIYVQQTHDVTAQAVAKKGNFVKARKRAVARAMKMAVENALVDLMGEKEFKANRRFLREILGNPQRFVQKYRFIESYDDPEAMISEVRLKVTLFSDAITKSLTNLGVIAGPVGLKTVLILIKETSLTDRGRVLFWDAVPISETALSQEFVGAGIEMVGRDPVRHIIPEEEVMKAIKGDLAAAVNIGLKAGADIVIVGNAASILVEKDVTDGEKTIQVSISVKAFSATRSALVAAKSDFATAKNKEPLLGELAAFGAASKKLSEFLLPSLHRHWEGGTEADKKVPPKKEAPPMPMTDL